MSARPDVADRATGDPSPIRSRRARGPAVLGRFTASAARRSKSSWWSTSRASSGSPRWRRCFRATARTCSELAQNAAVAIGESAAEAAFDELARAGPADRRRSVDGLVAGRSLGGAATRARRSGSGDAGQRALAHRAVSGLGAVGGRLRWGSAISPCPSSRLTSPTRSPAALTSRTRRSRCTPRSRCSAREPWFEPSWPACVARR